MLSDTCSFCGNPATDSRSGESDIFSVCEPCGKAWDADPEFVTDTGASRTTEAEPGDAEVVAGPVWLNEDEQGENGGAIWSAEIQSLGGYGVVATVHAGSEAEAVARQRAVLVALRSTTPNAVEAATVSKMEIVRREGERSIIAKLVTDLSKLDADSSCEGCGAPLWDGDDYVTDPDGVAGCWASMTDQPSKRERPCYAYRVGKPEAINLSDDYETPATPLPLETNELAAEPSQSPATPAAVDDDALVERLRELKKGWSTGKSFSKFIDRVIARFQSLLASVRVKDEALSDARLFVELVRVHWQNWHPDDEQQIAEAESCVAQIDAALSDQQGGV